MFDAADSHRVSTYRVVAMFWKYPPRTAFYAQLFHDSDADLAADRVGETKVVARARIHILFNQRTGTCNIVGDVLLDIRIRLSA